MHRKIALATVAAAALVIAPAAHAAPARTQTLAPGAEYKWTGGPISGADESGSTSESCLPGSCDETLIKLDVPGTLAVKITGDTTAADIDLYVYVSDASGTAGKKIKESVGQTASESTSAEVDPGYYLVRVVAAAAAASMYDGTAKLEASAPDPGAAVTPPAAAAPNAAPKTTVTKPKGKKITAIKGTASDDGAVAKVAVGLVQIKGKKCYGLTASGSFKALKKCTAPALLAAKGTTAWTLKLKKALKKGSYVAYAIATDDKGVAEGGYGPKNKVAFKVK